MLDFGPGHYTFSLLARHFGGEVICIEKDHTLANLGRKLGFEVVQADFLSEPLPAALGGHADRPFGGLWLRGVMNACKFADEVALTAYIETLHKLLAEDGWGWAASCNTTGSDTMDQVSAFTSERIEQQRSAFVRCGWDAQEVTDDMRKRYGLNFVGCRYIFSRNLPLLNDSVALASEYSG